MDITVYTVDGCHYCSQIKELFRRANLDFKKVKVGEDITRDEFLEKLSSIVFETPIQKRLANNILYGWAKRTPPPGSDRVKHGCFRAKL